MEIGDGLANKRLVIRLKGLSSTLRRRDLWSASFHLWISIQDQKQCRDVGSLPSLA